MAQNNRGWISYLAECVAKLPTYALMAAMTLAIGMATYLMLDEPSAARTPGQTTSGETMLILRGIANSEHPRGQLDDTSALEYARRLGYRGEVLDVAGNSSAQVSMALDRIRHDEHVTAIYGFSGGGYNTQRIWSQLKADERQRIGKIVVIGSPGVDESDFPGSTDVVIKKDPAAGHMAGPKALLESLEPG